MQSRLKIVNVDPCVSFESPQAPPTIANQNVTFGSILTMPDSDHPMVTGIGVTGTRNDNSVCWLKETLAQKQRYHNGPALFELIHNSGCTGADGLRTAPIGRGGRRWRSPSGQISRKRIHVGPPAFSALTIILQRFQCCLKWHAVIGRPTDPLERMPVKVIHRERNVWPPYGCVSIAYCECNACRAASLIASDSKGAAEVADRCDRHLRSQQLSANGSRHPNLFPVQIVGDMQLCECRTAGVPRSLQLQQELAACGF